jgi:hypothetical protein
MAEGIVCVAGHIARFVHVLPLVIHKLSANINLRSDLEVFVGITVVKGEKVITEENVNSCSAEWFTMKALVVL